jgi:hypothetical protein
MLTKIEALTLGYIVSHLKKWAPDGASTNFSVSFFQHLFIPRRYSLDPGGGGRILIPEGEHPSLLSALNANRGSSPHTGANIGSLTQLDDFILEGQFRP